MIQVCPGSVVSNGFMSCGLEFRIKLGDQFFSACRDISLSMCFVSGRFHRLGF